MEIKEYAKAFNNELSLAGLRRDVTSYTFNSRCLMVYSLFELEDYEKCVVMLDRTINGVMADLLENRINNKKLVLLGIVLLEQIQNKIPVKYFTKFDRDDMLISIYSIKNKLE